MSALYTMEHDTSAPGVIVQPFRVTQVEEVIHTKVREADLEQILRRVYWRVDQSAKDYILRVTGIVYVQSTRFTWDTIHGDTQSIERRAIEVEVFAGSFILSFDPTAS